MSKVYYAAVDGYIHGRQRKRGDRIGPLTEREAKYPAMAGLIIDKKPVEPVEAAPAAPEQPEPSPATLGRKTR